MKKFLTIAFITCTSQSAVLKIPLELQQHDQWCWAGSTTAILNYYNKNIRQCDVANFTRIASANDPSRTFDFGITDCCADTTTFSMSTAAGSCNHPNYTWGKLGSIAEIFSNWNIPNGTLTGVFSKNQIQSEINAGHPFIITYTWTSGGGHVMVGRGFDSTTSNVYIMNPWPGEGYKIVDYNTTVTAWDHNWTHTNSISKSPTNLSNAFESSSSANVSSSSINILSSASIANGNCAGINNWNPSISYTNPNTQVIYNNNLWTNQWWANAGDEPGVNAVWKNQGACNLSSSSSSISSSAVVSSSFISSSSIASSSSVLSSSSVFINSSANQSSSSTNIVANLNNINLTLIDYSLFGIHWNQTVDYSYLYNANGILILENRQNNAFKFQSPLTPGFYFLKIQQNQQVQSWWLNIR